jgi:hypothetical protein
VWGWTLAKPVDEASQTGALYMYLLPDDVCALESQIQSRAEAAKRAIRAYNHLILRETASVGGEQKLERQREVAHAVNKYMQVRRRLDELRAKMSTDSGR